MHANDFAKKDGVLCVHMIGHGVEPKKSDAFLLEYDGTYIMIDGGMEACDASRRYLLEIRRTLLAEHEALVEDTSCRLKLDVMISHCHNDHVGALHSVIFPSPYVEIGTLYMPPECGLDLKYGPNGDVKYRPLLQKAIESYQPQVTVRQNGFGTENRFEIAMAPADSASPIITVCPPWINNADEGRIKCLINALWDGDGENPNIATMVMNNNSNWIHVRHGSRTFLFTGDTVKKNKPMGYEMVEEMIEAYSSVLGQVDVVKYVHHGFKRNGAAEAMMSLSPSYVVVTTVLATGDEAIRKKFPESDVKLLNCGVITYVFASDGETLTISPED